MDINKRNNEKQLRKTIVTYLILSVTAVVIDKVYGIFSHGVDSKAMTWMFLYPLIGGALIYFIIEKFMPHIIRFEGYRGFLNIHNSGIATLTIASFLKGIFEIAGTNSPFLQYFYIVGVAFLIVGLGIMVIMVINQNKVNA
ncbi:MAG: hypothetical protein RR409_02100 [Clostridium sp.]